MSYRRTLSLTALLAALVAPLLATPAAAQTAYVSDELTVPLRSGPSTGHRILHAGLPSGTQMEVIGQDEAAGYTQIRTVRGTEGWVRSQYLVNQPIAKVRLAAAQRELQAAQRQLNQARDQVRELRANNQSQASANQQGQSRITSLENELAELKRISAGAIDQHNENQQLRETNERLRDELDDIAEARNRLEDNAENEAILMGAAMILIGLIAGVVIKSRPQRSAWS